ncbi:MAG: hypothetical protein MJ197_10035 [Bacteroidales bacterium]|nr:hypothetical protein [Bacteroidales bacterium]
MNYWINKTTRPKNEVFICPNCKGEVRYTDCLARRKHNKRIAQCDYVFCGWCGHKNNDDNEKKG